MDDPQDDEAPRPRRPWLRRWGVVALTAAVLLALSQALWWWETASVRQLLQAPASGGTR